MSKSIKPIERESSEHVAVEIKLSTILEESIRFALRDTYPQQNQLVRRWAGHKSVAHLPRMSRPGRIIPQYQLDLLKQLIGKLAFQLKGKRFK